MAVNREKELKKALALEAKRPEIRPDADLQNRGSEKLKKAWYKFSRNQLSVAGLVIVVLVIAAAFLAPVITPYPEHAGAYTDFANSMKAPCAKFLLGTDNMGRDILTRLIYSFRGALYMSVLVLAIAVPAGSILGMIAGYMKGTVVDTLIMRLTDIFLSVPAMILALAVASIPEPNLRNSMIAVTIMWWPWYCRIVYGTATSCRQENFVIGAELMGATLSYVGLGEQPPPPSLGQMISDGARYMPDGWWMTIFPALAIVIIILGFNFMGDGIGDMLSKGEGKNE